jgi:Protein of unknown function (DUF2846)
MFGRGVALVLGALLLCSCQTTERHGLDYAAMTQKIGPPKAGQAHIVMLREKTFSIVDADSRFELDGEPVRGLKTGTYVYADRPAGQHRFTASEGGFPGTTEIDIAVQSGRTYFYVVRMSDRKAAIVANGGNGVLGLVLSTALTAGYKNPGPLDFLPLEEAAARTAIAELRSAE